MAQDFQDRHIIVTGGTGALGTAVVGQLLDAGAICHIPSLHAHELQRFPHASRARIAPGVDLADEASVEGFYARFRNGGGSGGAGSEGGAGGVPLWASIHIAGGFAMAPIEECSAADFDAQLRMNLLTCFLCCREAVRCMRGGPSAASPRGGRIVNIAARPALIPETGAGMTAYTASKAGVAALTQALAAEVAPFGILANAVAPSIMDTPANRKAMPDADHARWPKVDEVARTICFLASPANEVTRGGLVPVYGRS